MRKLLVLLLALLLTAALCTAEESQPVEAARFTVELPAGMTPDLDEYSLKDYSGKALYVFHCACLENDHLTVTLHP